MHRKRHMQSPVWLSIINMRRILDLENKKKVVTLHRFKVYHLKEFIDTYCRKSAGGLFFSW